MIRSLRSLPLVLSSRRGAWVSLLIGVLALFGVIGVLGRADLGSAAASAPPDSESAQVAAAAALFPDAEEQTLLVAAERVDGEPLSPEDLASLETLATTLEQRDVALRAIGPFPADDPVAAVVQATIVVGDEEDAAKHAVAAVRAVVSDQPIDGLAVHVTGGPAFGVDVAGAFDGADLTLLLVTIAIVAVLLIITYRSPVLWLIPLAVVGVADQVAGSATAALGTALDLQFDGGIVSVLVFGAGTNYALLLVSRYREELAVDTDHRAALARAWRGTAPAILASNVTVVLALLTLVLAVIPGTRGLGLTSALGLIIALAAALLVLPPALAVCGRGVFWPFIPRPGGTGRQGRAWRAVAATVGRRPWPGLVAGTVLLAVMATGLIGASVGLSQAEKFRTPSESAAGLEVLAEHFEPGQAQPLTVVADADHAPAVVDAVSDVPGILHASIVAETTDTTLARILVTGQPAPGTAESLQLVRDVREVAHAVPGAAALVGGQGAADLDARVGNLRDIVVIVPLVLAVTLGVLIVLLRALVAPLILLVVNVASAVAAIGAGTWLSRMLFGWESLDLQVPLLSFLFLVALGVDYTIFLVHRARTEAARVGTRRGIVDALAATGAVITSAGVVLAGVFAALGLLPLVTLGQIGLIVGIGVLVDTLVVRTAIVPALFTLLGDRMWLPGRVRPSAPARPVQREESEYAADHAPVG